MQDIAPLSEERTKQLLKGLRDALTKVVSVTLVQDANGVWGEMGAVYLTLRMSGPDKCDLIQVTTKVLSVSSSNANSEQQRLDREDK